MTPGRQRGSGVPKIFSLPTQKIAGGTRRRLRTVNLLPERRNPRRAPALPDSGLEGTITLDIDPQTGLIAVETCPVIRTKTFVLGTEPKKYCGPQYHQHNTIEPAGSGRPRVVGTPQQH